MPSHQGLTELEAYAAQIAFPAQLLEPSREVRLMTNARWLKVLIVAAIVVLAVVHWYVPREEKHIHNLLYHRVFLPIVAAGMLFGWRSAALATLLTSFAAAPQIFVL